MTKKTLLLLISFAFLSCSKTSKVEKQIADKQTDSLSVNKEVLKSETNVKTESKTQNWYDDLIADYIRKSDNELIKSSLKNKERIEWLLDRTEKTDSTNYYIFNIGQNVSEEDGSESRFTSNGWIYIDSISKKIYEYDLPNDSLIVWKNKHNR
ncbi:hypothetical protein [Flavobacterium sp. IMCC34518]|uniref:hypothetical protein n=1 Tax=Flavobacterium sp. IMCC34518 TaxID=3003623 RepID=UPI0022AC87AF|nr:hypothetical protein [Flavobacterium sp. IMCC34518]